MESDGSWSGDCFAGGSYCPYILGGDNGVSFADSERLQPWTSNRPPAKAAMAKKRMSLQSHLLVAEDLLSDFKSAKRGGV
jgi:hypothetical protein